MKNKHFAAADLYQNGLVVFSAKTGEISDYRLNDSNTPTIFDSVKTQPEMIQETQFNNPNQTTIF